MIKDAQVLPLLKKFFMHGQAAMQVIKRHVQTLIDKGAFTKAISSAAEYVRRNPESTAGHLLVAMAEEASGYTKAAIQTISHAIDLTPDEPSLRIMRARLFLKDNRLKEAIADVNAIIDMSSARHATRYFHEAIACRDELLDRMSSVCLSRRTQKTTGTSTQCVV